MRSILILLIVLGIQGTASAAEEVSRAGDEAVTVIAEVRPGGTHLTIRDDAEIPFAEPVVRFLAVEAEDAADPIRIVDSQIDSPGLSVTLGAPLILRGIRMVPLTIEREAEAKAGSVPSVIEIPIQHASSAKNAAEPSPALIHGHGFYSAFADLLIDGEELTARATERGSYLIISAPRYASAVAPLAQWKREKGLEVTVVTTDETGLSNGQIRAYVADAYRTWSNPPAYLLLIGDVDVLPSWDFHQSVSDHPYTTVDGDDFIGDLHVGRLSVSSLPEAETIVAKIIGYEREPYVAEGTDWFSRALVVGGNYGSSTPVPVCRWIRGRLMDIGYTQVDSLYYPPWFTDYRQTIPTAFNEGVTIVNYRGWAYGVFGWEPPHFTTAEIPALSNGWKLPVVFSFVCQNNDFSHDEVCFGESLIREGSPTEPKGAVAAIGNSEPWSHTRNNDAAAIGAFRAITSQGISRLGEVLDAVKMETMRRFPNEISYSEFVDWSVEFQFYIYSLLGDPEMEIWLGPPLPIEVSHAAAVSKGMNSTEVTVLDEGTGIPIVGARVGLSQGENVLGSAFTDENGLAHVSASFDVTGEVLVTVTGANAHPYQGTFEVTESVSFVGFESMTIDDDAAAPSSGNGDGLINPGETVELTVSVMNHGSGTASQVSANLIGSLPSWAQVSVDQAAIGDIPSGGQATATNPFVITVDPAAEDGATARVQMELGDGPNLYVSEFDLTVVAPSLRYDSMSLGDEGALMPGGSATLWVTIRNDGAATATTSSAVLSAIVPDLVTITTATAALPNIEIGGSETTETAFALDVAGDLHVGTAIPLKLTVTTQEGYVSETGFSAVVGVPEHYTPLGPDAYGYYAYDNSDTDYPDAAPLFDYITCSTAYGGAGTKLEIADNKFAFVDLPFEFTFYGQTYTEMMISDNGWVAFDLSTEFDYYNWPVPDPYGQAARIAPFWDNLDPTKVIPDNDNDDSDDILVGDGIYVFYDEELHAYIVEWSRLANYFPALDDLQTFELILFDPAFHPTPTGDGMIQFQYKSVTNNDFERMYCTVGIEDHTETVGLQYTYINEYPPQAAPISSGLAIKITTQPARYSPFRLAEFKASRQADGVLLSWEPIDDRPRGSFCIYRGPAGEECLRLEGLSLGADARSFLDSTADPDTEYTYMIGSYDPVGRETVLGPYPYTGQIDPALGVALSARTPNPFRGSVDLSYTVPRGGEVNLRVFDLSGRLVRTLVEASVTAGVWEATWDGRDDRGHDAPSGVYLMKLVGGGQERTLKTALLR